MTDKDGRYAQAWCDIGDILAAEGDWEGAHVHYQKALDLDSHYHLTSTASTVPTTSGEAAALRGLGCCACARNNAREGVKLLKQALKIAPNDHVTNQLLLLAEDRTQTQGGDDAWKYNSRLSMIAGQLLCIDPTQAGHAAKCLEAGIRGNRILNQKLASKSELLKLGSALYMKQGSAHAPGSRLI